jgi:hypothetical protein
MIRLIRSSRADEFAQAAIALPLVVLLTIALLNLTMAGFASVNASNAANYGARVGSVHQRNAAGTAYAAAQEAISHALVGTYTINVSGGGFPGAQINVRVDWQVPNYLDALLAFFGGGPVELKGSATSTFRQEGW